MHKLQGTNIAFHEGVAREKAFLLFITQNIGGSQFLFLEVGRHRQPNCIHFYSADCSINSSGMDFQAHLC